MRSAAESEVREGYTRTDEGKGQGRNEMDSQAARGGEEGASEGKGEREREGKEVREEI